MEKYSGGTLPRSWIRDIEKRRAQVKPEAIPQQIQGTLPRSWMREIQERKRREMGAPVVPERRRPRIVGAWNSGTLTRNLRVRGNPEMRNWEREDDFGPVNYGHTYDESMA